MKRVLAGNVVGQNWKFRVHQNPPQIPHLARGLAIPWSAAEKGRGIANQAVAIVVAFPYNGSKGA